MKFVIQTTNTTVYYFKTRDCWEKQKKTGPGTLIYVYFSVPQLNNSNYTKIQSIFSILETLTPWHQNIIAFVFIIFVGISVLYRLS